VLRSIGLPELLIIFLIGVFLSAFVVAPFWKIATKAGYPGWYALAYFIPFLNVIVLWWFAFSEWPIQRGLEGRRR
jgi:hypothetical protein